VHKIYKMQILQWQSRDSLCFHETGIASLYLQASGGGRKEGQEFLFKVLIIGELGTGKTSIIKRYVHQFFSEHYRATVSLAVLWLIVLLVLVYLVCFLTVNLVTENLVNIALFPAIAVIWIFVWQIASRAVNVYLPVSVIIIGVIILVQVVSVHIQLFFFHVVVCSLLSVTFVHPVSTIWWIYMPFGKYRVQQKSGPLEFFAVFSATV